MEEAFAVAYIGYSPRALIDHIVDSPPVLLIRLVLGFALFETLVLAGVLLRWADKVAGARLLAAFLVGIAVWICGNELPNWTGQHAEPAALALLATAPLTSALFFHFCVVFSHSGLGRGVVLSAYALGGAGTLMAELRVPGHLVWQRDVGWIAEANDVGWFASVAWVILGIGGVAILLRALLQARPPAFNQLAAVTASCLWGLLCLAGYGIAVLDLPVYPFPLLGLPLYPVILVYGILRYGVFVANAWARRALVWALLLGLGAAIVPLTPLLPIESRWLAGLVVAASCLALNGPVRRFAERLVYPGGAVSAADVQVWRRELQAAASLPQLAQDAQHLLGQRVGTTVAVRFGDRPEAGMDAPCLWCRPEEAGWQVELLGWEAAPPGLRQVGELFGSVVAEMAGRVAQAEQATARERERQAQARLAELGALAATVAHDIRNPLNIISMAVALAPPETRREVSQQVARVAHLASDLLDYAKPWSLAPTRIDLAALVRGLVQRFAGGSLGPGLADELLVEADAQRVEQALLNLFENAQTADAQGARRGWQVDAEAGAGLLKLHVCDNGPGVPEEIRARVFEPFVSRSPGGTGLGLAIAARVMVLHGGAIALSERPPWRTCFTLSFPLARP